MARIWKDREGSGLIWAMAAGAFLLIIVTAVLTISNAYGNRSVDNNKEQQAYLTARSGVDLIVKEFLEGSLNSDDILVYLEKYGSWSTNDVGFDERMGTCSLTAVLLEPESKTDTKRTIEITATAVADGKTQTVKATISGVLQREGDPNASAPVSGGTDESGGEVDPLKTPLTWYVVSYEDGGRSDVSS